MIRILSIIFLLLLLLIGKKQGLKTYICFYLNYFLIIIYIVFMSFGFNAILMSLITCILATILSLFVVNGINLKTKSSFISVLIVQGIIFILIFLIGNVANIQGFSYESIEAIGGFSYDINYNMTDLIIGLVLICTMGTIIDTSISISTALNELYLNNKTLESKELFDSGMNVGRDILSTTINTLFFVFLGGILGFFFWHYNENFLYIINYKVFAQELIELMCCCIGSIIVIPITSYIVSKSIINKK